MNIEQLVKRVLREKNWSSTYMFNLNRQETPHLIEAAINTHSWEIQLTVDPEIEKKAVQSFPNNTEDVLSDMIYMVLSHEKGHWEYCPFDIEYFEAIYSGVSDAITQEWNKDYVDKFAPRIANQFMDIIVNTNLAFKDREKKRCKEGIYNFYNNSYIS